MSILYKASFGDKFENIARSFYGTEALTPLLVQANSGVSIPLIGGELITIPDNPNAPNERKFFSDSSNENEVSILISGKRFRFWTQITIERRMDAVDVVKFTGPFDQDNSELRNSFRPFAYRRVEIYIGDSPLFTGTLIAVDPSVNSKRKTISASCYSLPGVLADCTMPINAGVQFNEASLLQVASEIAAPFGLAVEVNGDQGENFFNVGINEYTNVMHFMKQIALERDFVIGSTPRGKMLFERSIDVGQEVAKFEQGSSPLMEISTSFNPQEYYSTITGVQTIFGGIITTPVSIINDRLQAVVRPLNFVVKDGDVDLAVKSKIGRMFANAVAYTIKVATWRDFSGNLWKPNTFVSVLAPGAMIYNRYKFVIRSVQFFKDSKSEIATLTLIPPGSFSGKQPDTLPWD